MKILVLIHEYPPVGGGGGPIARDIAAVLSRRGHQIRFVTAAYGDLPEREVLQGMEIVRLKSHRNEAFRASLKTMVSFVFVALKYCLCDMKDFEPDMVHVHFAVPNGLIAFLYRIIKRKPYVLTAHLGDIPGGSPEKTKKWFRYILPFTPPIWKSAAVAVAVSEYSKSLVEKVYPVPVRVIYNGVDYQRIKIDANDIVTHAVPQIVFAGRFVKQKNIPQIVNVLEQLRTLPWHCVLIGDGEQKEMIQALISDKGLTDRFEFPGWKTPDEVMAIFKCSDILFLPSLYEGLPVVAIQAMACGLALVASNAGGNAEIVREGVNGFSADYDDTARFCESLTMLINNKDLLLELRKNALALAAQYDIEKIGQQYEMLFTEIVDKPTLRGAK